MEMIAAKKMFYQFSSPLPDETTKQCIPFRYHRLQMCVCEWFKMIVFIYYYDLAGDQTAF